MRRITYFIFLLASLASKAQIKAMVGGTLIDGFGSTPILNSVIIIDGTRIAAVGTIESIEVPTSAEIISTEGMSVLPGLWDMHTHLINEPYTKEVFYPLFIANGITGIRVMAADCFEPCDEPNMTILQHRSLQNEINEGKLLKRLRYEKDLRCTKSFAPQA